jgi:hypothetical protein
VLEEGIIFFGWLLFCDRLNTWNMLRRKRKALDDYSCALCSFNLDESLEHIVGGNWAQRWTPT